MERVTLSKGNSKLQNGFLIWNLPELKTCPGSTEECRKTCYASKASRMYPSVSPCRERNYTASKERDFPDLMVEKIAKTSKGYRKFNKNKFFRIHESGDFYSQSYLNSWIRIVKEFPDTAFLAYTKSFHLDFSEVPQNLRIVSSIMSDTKADPVPGTSKAYAGKCKTGGEKVYECPGACDGCFLCWYMRDCESIHFDIH